MSNLIDTLVENFVETKIDKKEYLRQILELKKQANDLQIANGQTPRTTLEQHVQRIVAGDISADKYAVQSHQKILENLKYSFGV